MENRLQQSGATKPNEVPSLVSCHEMFTWTTSSNAVSSLTANAYIARFCFSPSLGLDPNAADQGVVEGKGGKSACLKLFRDPFIYFIRAYELIRIRTRIRSLTYLFRLQCNNRLDTPHRCRQQALCMW